MNRILSPTTLAIMGLALFGQGFIFQGVFPDMLKIFGMVLVIIGATDIFRSWFGTLNLRWLKKLKILIYPKIKHDKIWHRAVTVIGWAVSVFSYFILFPIYFGIVQRIIYFVVYGDKKEEWLIKENSQSHFTKNKELKKLSEKAKNFRSQRLILDKQQ